MLALTAILGIVLLSEMGKVNAGGAYVGTNSLPSVSAIAHINDMVQNSRVDTAQGIINVVPSKAPDMQTVTGDIAAVDQGLLAG